MLVHQRVMRILLNQLTILVDFRRSPDNIGVRFLALEKRQKRLLSDFPWLIYGYYMVIIWLLYGYYMVIIYIYMVNNNLVGG